MVNIFFIAAGFIALGLGVVGTFVPVLPTTPFLFLACLCFAKGSDRFHRWFLGTWLYKKYLADFVRTRGMTLRAKLSLCLTVTALLAVPFTLLQSLALRLLIVALLAVKWWYFMFRIKTIER